MADKITAIYLMVRYEELKPEDQGSYEAPLKRQKEECLRFLEQKTGEKKEENVEVYTKRSQLLKDIERDRVQRLVVYSVDRLGSNKEEIDGLLYELQLRQVELLSVTE
ncbi:recombinase family protein [Desulforhabdus amnigena]|jgi:DNA invertase Pin-like site-specific DNA recombinase|uniref:Resolvase/invertase-type recombinase catalytic domain-containing protein n=1 Tax=Desulforhabdus amnigena TaxID=40218 RepID=A0A9W6D2H5_9BACT|nr:recombinase family protein [Desulforhabdus amnigena]NLJ27210.1 recombinase family protein [Deltaproteobacteria bacterium]GLI34063.1 hypothetical protein DAMNIGENAA_14960 [Desulforhabdus amnigena]